ncbi:MAG: hypothetical protein J6P72_00785 [Firmicutes bacterium]|nr:hypothetical protein [Bacillota bacterium]
MRSCISCKGPGELHLRALEVRTLPIRDISGESKVQALGDFVEGSVCRSCAKKQLELELDPFQARKKSNLAFALIFCAGILVLALTFLWLNGQWVFAALGIAAMICGVFGLINNIRSALSRKKELSGLPEEEALSKAAWSVFLQHSPKKEGDADLTYIPINQETLKRKNGDLMILYHLLPAIAVEAHKRIHEKENG